MRTATALAVAPLLLPGRDEDVQPPLPFPHLRPVLPAPVERASVDEVGHPLRERAGRFMQALAEVLSGIRPARQLSPWVAPAVYQQLLDELESDRPVTRRGAGVRVVSVHVAMVNAETAEIAARMVRRGRSHAIAVRLELQRDARGHAVWRCTALSWA